MTSLQSLQLSKALQLVSEEEQSYESTILASPLRCESNIKMEESLDDGEIWLEDLAAAESPRSTKGSHVPASDTLVIPPRRRPSFGCRRNSGGYEYNSNRIQAKQILAGAASTKSRRSQSMDLTTTSLSQSTGAIQCDPVSFIPHSTCFLRTRALSVGAIDIASWKQADRCRRRSKGNSSLQEVSKSLRALPREELIELEELNKSSMNEPSDAQRAGRNISTSRSRSPGSRQATRSMRRGSFYGSLEDRLSKSTGAIDFTWASSSNLTQRACVVQARRTRSFGAGDSRSSSKQKGAGASADRRRMLKGKHQLLQGPSTSVRALPREAEIEMADDDNHLENSFQAIFDAISDIDTKVRSIMKELET